MTRILDVLGEFLDLRSYNYVRFDGSTKPDLFDLYTEKQFTKLYILMRLNRFFYSYQLSLSG